MDERREAAEVNARIVYWGVAGAGKLTNLRVIHAKLRPDHRGELRERRTRLDPTVTYALLPIELGEVSGVRTRIQVLTVPSGDEQAPTRKQLLDGADGIVFVADTTPDRVDENLASFEELRGALAAYGRPLEQVPLVIQYNKRDQSDPFVLDELHRKLGMRGVAAFEAVASEGTAVLQTLTTISKRVIRHRRELSAQPSPEQGPAAPPRAPSPPPGTTQLLMDLEQPAADAPAPGPEAPAPEAPTPPPAPAPEAPAALEPELLATAPQNDGELASVFDPAFPESAEAPPAEARGESEATPSAGNEAVPGAGNEAAPPLFAVKGLGTPARADAQTVTVPVLLRDAEGRERHVTLRLRIEAIEEGGA